MPPPTAIQKNGQGHGHASKLGLLACFMLVLVSSTWDSVAGHYGLTNKMSEYEKSNIRLSTMSGFRTDARRSMDARPVTLEVAVLPDAFGSARVRIGKTDVVAAVKAEFSKPYPPGRIGPGPLMFQVDLRGIGGAGIAQVPRDDDFYADDYAFEVCRTLEKLYNTFATRVITDQRLAIIPGKLNWLLNVYVTAFESDGNVLDACVMAVRGALRSTWFPHIHVDLNAGDGLNLTEVRIDEDRSRYWRLDSLACPLTVTYLRVGSEWVIDPTEEEECAGDARLILGLRLPKFQEGEVVQVTEEEHEAGTYSGATLPDVPAGSEFPSIRMPNMSSAAVCFVDFEARWEEDDTRLLGPWQTDYCSEESNERAVNQIYEEAAAAGWREEAAYGGWGSAEAAAAAAAAGWKGGAARGEKEGLGVTNEIEDSDHWNSFPPHWVEYVKNGTPPGVPYNAFLGAPSGGPTKCTDTWGERLGPDSAVVKINPDDWITYTHDDYMRQEVDEVLSSGSVTRLIVTPRQGTRYQHAAYVQGLDDVVARKRKARMAVSPEDYGYYDADGCFTTPHEKLGLQPGDTAHTLDDREAWQEWLAPRKAAMHAALHDPATRPRWTRIFETAFLVGLKMLQQMEAFLATRGHEPVYSFPVTDVLRNMTQLEQEMRDEEADSPDERVSTHQQSVGTSVCVT